MFRLAVAVLFAAALTLTLPAQAGEFNKKVKIGDAAPTFAGLQGVDDKSHSLDDFKDKDVLVVCITCNHCPVAVAYEDRIIDFCKQHCSADSKVGFIAINVNNNDADKLPRMKERAKEKGFNFVYAYDPSQKIGRDLGATVTPEFFVLNKERKVVYLGAMDDNIEAKDVKNNYLEPAIEAALKGESAPRGETRPFGCPVKYEK